MTSTGSSSSTPPGPRRSGGASTKHDPQETDPPRRTRPRRRSKPKGWPLEVVTFRCDAVADLEPRSLGFTYWLETSTDAEGGAHPVSIRFTGRRTDVKGKPTGRDSFTIVETLDRVVPGSGPLAITARARDVTPGEWRVTATPVRGTRPPARTSSKSTSRLALPTASASAVPGYGPVIRILAPGARFGAWPALVLLGALVALTTQALLARRAGLPTTRVLVVSVASSLIGLVGAKLYYLVEHRRRPRSVLTPGMCIQGFVLAAAAALVAGALVTDVAAGRVLDVSAPGLLFGMAIGRVGCFFGGCCAGRPTGSRWGLWSSDRHIGARRIPTQLLEGAAALTIGISALLVALAPARAPAGTVFAAAIAAYTLGRQLLFPLRDLPRRSHHLSTLAGALAALVLAVAVGLIIAGSR